MDRAARLRSLAEFLDLGDEGLTVDTPLASLPVDSLGLIEWLLGVEEAEGVEFDIETFEDQWDPEITLGRLLDVMDQAVLDPTSAGTV